MTAVPSSYEESQPFTDSSCSRVWGLPLSRALVRATTGGVIGSSYLLRRCPRMRHGGRVRVVTAEVPYDERDLRSFYPEDFRSGMCIQRADHHDAFADCHGLLLLRSSRPET